MSKRFLSLSNSAMQIHEKEKEPDVFRLFLFLLGSFIRIDVGVLEAEGTIVLYVSFEVELVDDGAVVDVANSCVLKSLLLRSGIEG